MADEKPYREYSEYDTYIANNISKDDILQANIDRALGASEDAYPDLNNACGYYFEFVVISYLLKSYPPEEGYKYTPEGNQVKAIKFFEKIPSNLDSKLVNSARLDIEAAGEVAAGSLVKEFKEMVKEALMTEKNSKFGDIVLKTAKQVNYLIELKFTRTGKQIKYSTLADETLFSKYSFIYYLGYETDLFQHNYLKEKWINKMRTTSFENFLKKYYNVKDGDKTFLFYLLGKGEIDLTKKMNKKIIQGISINEKKAIITIDLDGLDSAIEESLINYKFGKSVVVRYDGKTIASLRLDTYVKNQTVIETLGQRLQSCKLSFITTLTDNFFSENRFKKS